MTVTVHQYLRQFRVFVLALCTLMLVSPPARSDDGEEIQNHSITIGPVHVISMESGKVTPEQAVITREGLIDRIISYTEAMKQPAATLVDGKNGYLIPGLAEMHAHIPSRGRGEQYARDLLVLYLANGITTARGMLGEPWHLEVREKLATQEWVGPRLITSGPSFNGRSVSSPSQAAGKVSAQAEAGYDFVKLHPGLLAEEFEAITAAAYEEKMPVAGHVSFAVGLDMALRLGQATIDHLDGYAQEMVPENSPLSGEAPSFFGLNLASAMDIKLAPRLARATASAGVWNVPTQSLIENWAGERRMKDLLSGPGMIYVSGELKQRWINNVSSLREQSSVDSRRRFITLRRGLIQELQAAGAGLLLGSDAPQVMNVPGFSIHQELEYLVQSGLTPLQALQSGTRNVAAFFDAGNQGEVKSAYVADLVLLRSNPLEGITATSDILGVMRAGTWYGREQLDRMLAAIEARGI
jgi:imidazolonepropionase-like amidohydrolase